MDFMDEVHMRIFWLELAWPTLTIFTAMIMRASEHVRGRYISERPNDVAHVFWYLFRN